MSKSKITEGEIYSLINAHFTEQLARGNIPWHTFWKEHPKDIFGGPYSGINLWLLVHKQYPRNIFLSKTQLTSFKLTVRKREQGHSVLSLNERRGRRSVTLRKVYNIDQLQGLHERLLPHRWKNIISCNAVVILSKGCPTYPKL